MSSLSNNIEHIPTITTATILQHHNAGMNEFYTKHDGTQIRIAPFGDANVSGGPVPYNYYTDFAGNNVQYVPMTRLYAPVNQTVPCFIDVPTTELESPTSLVSTGPSPSPLLSSSPEPNSAVGVRRRSHRATVCRECGLPVPRSQSGPSSLEH